MSNLLRTLSRTLAPSEEEQKRLLRNLVMKSAVDQPMVNELPPPILTRTPPVQPVANEPMPVLNRTPSPNVGEPPPMLSRSPSPNVGPADPIPQMELVRRAVDQFKPSYSNWDYGDSTDMNAPTFPTRGLALPNPNVNMVPDAATPPPDLPMLTRPMQVRVGESTEGMSPLDRLITRRNVTADSGASSKINSLDPNFVEVLPPHLPSRGKSFLRGLGMGALRGLAAGGLGGAVGGAVTGGAIGAISPNTLSRYQRQEELSHQDQELAREFAIQKERAQIGDMQAQTIQRLRPQTYAPHIQADENGYLQSIQNGTASPVIDRQGNPIRAKHDAEYVIEGGVIYEKTPNGLKSAIDTRVNYDGYKVSPTTAVNANATSQREQGRINRENRKESGSRAAALAQAAASDAAAADHQRKVNTASAQVSALQKQLTEMGTVSEDDPRRIILKQEMDRVQKTVETEQAALVSESQKSASAKAEALKYPAEASSGETGTFSISKARAGGLSETEAKAKAARAKQAGWTIVD
jgi:hypothetical protein